MKTITHTVASVEVTIKVPSSLQEAIDMFSEEKVLLYFIEHTLYTTYNAAFRKKLAAQLESITKIKRAFLTRDGDTVLVKGRPILISESVYFKQLLDNNHITPEYFQVIAQNLAGNMHFKSVE